MFATLASPLPCETMKDTTTSCNKPARLGTLRVMETVTNAAYVLTPICPRCIAALAMAAGQVAAPLEAIEATTIKHVLAARLGLEGAEETLLALRATASHAEGDDGED